MMKETEYPTVHFCSLKDENNKYTEVTFQFGFEFSSFFAQVCVASKNFSGILESIGCI